MVASTCSENSETCVSGCPQQAAIGESLRHGQRESKQNDSGKIKRLDYYDSGWQSKELRDFRGGTTACQLEPCTSWNHPSSKPRRAYLHCVKEPAIPKGVLTGTVFGLSLIHISEPTR